MKELFSPGDRNACVVHTPSNALATLDLLCLGVAGLQEWAVTSQMLHISTNMERTQKMQSVGQGYLEKYKDFVHDHLLPGPTLPLSPHQ